MEIVEQFIKHNFTRGRSRPIDMIVIHVMQGDLPSDISDPYDWFNNPSALASAHFGIDRDDKPIRQWVRVEDTAWHAGKKVRPTARLIKERRGLNPNTWSIGIENEGSGKVPPTPIQILRNVQLIKKFNVELGIPIDRDHIIGHDEIRADKACPGLIDVDVLVKTANAIDGGFMMNKVLKRGDVGDDVELLQHLLVRLGYMTQIEMATGPGIFGPKTDRAFDEFIKAHHKK